MKIFLCLLAAVTACNATFLNLLGDKGGGSSGGNHIAYNAIAKPIHGVGHGLKGSLNYGYGYGHYNSHSHGGSTQVIKVILDEGHSAAHEGSGGYSYANGHSYGSSVNGHGTEAKIFKVITQKSAGLTAPHINHGYSASNFYGGPLSSSYAPGYSYSSHINDILPHILPFILQHNVAYGSGGGSVGGVLNPQLIANFGRKGEAFITESKGKPNSFYSGGRVIEKGVLKLRRIEDSPIHPYPAKGPPANSYLPHGPPVHKCPPHGHGW